MAAATGAHRTATMAGQLKHSMEPNEIIMAITQDSGAANQIKLYRNGAFYARSPSKGTLRWSLAGCKAVIGPRFGQDGYMNGYVNEARLYDRALSTAEIAALAGLTLFISSQPQNQMVLVGQTATFTVGAGGGAPYFFPVAERRCADRQPDGHEPDPDKR